MLSAQALESRRRLAHVAYVTVARTTEQHSAHSQAVVNTPITVGSRVAVTAGFTANPRTFAGNHDKRPDNLSTYCLRHVSLRFFCVTRENYVVIINRYETNAQIITY